VPAETPAAGAAELGPDPDAPDPHPASSTIANTPTAQRDVRRPATSSSMTFPHRPDRMHSGRARARPRQLDRTQPPRPDATTSSATTTGRPEKVHPSSASAP
jgi:hypothetical protein